MSTSDPFEWKFPAKWEVILKIENQLPQATNHICSCITGWKKMNKDDTVMKADSSVGKFIQAKQEINILKIGISRDDPNLSSFQSSNDLVIMNQLDILTTKEEAYKAKVPPQTKYVKWQLCIDVAGNIVYSNEFIVNNGEKPREAGAVALVQQFRNPIEYETTELRFKHVTTEKYLIVTTRYNLPAADLGISKEYKFQLVKTTSGKIRIKALNSWHPGRNILYSTVTGAIYFERNEHEKGQQLWSISNTGPLFDGDIVEFRNVKWPTAGLSFYEGPETSIYCKFKKFDKWILEVC